MRPVLILAVTTALALAAGRAAAAVPFSEEVARVSALVTAYEARARSTGSWIDQESAAAALTERARLTGGFDDLAAAEAWLDRAFEGAPEGAGPHLARASLDFTLHRFDRVEAGLRAAEQRILRPDPLRSSIAALRAELRFQEGRWSEARQGFEEALALHATPDGFGRLARARAAEGDTAAADSLYALARARDHGPAAWSKAWVHVQRGLLDEESGDLSAALAHYDEAERELSGWWVVAERRAAVRVRQGDVPGAIHLLRGIAERVPRPAPARVLADLLREAGAAGEARHWDDVATARTRDLERRFPEVAHGHSHSHASGHASGHAHPH